MSIDRTVSADDWREAYEGASANGARLGTELAAARAELDAFAATPIPDGLDDAAVMVISRVTAPFVGRMRAALGGAQ